MGVHESGHVFGAWATGGTVTQVVLHPLSISRTDVAPNPCPMIVAWAGPIFGVSLPVIVWVAFRWLRLPGEFMARFFAAFCLIANGLYIGLGVFPEIGDAGDLIRGGAPNWLLWLFGTVTAPAGFWLWHRSGQQFGLSDAQGKVSPVAAYISATLLTIILIASLSLSNRH